MRQNVPKQYTIERVAWISGFVHMDPVTALGLASAIVSLVDFGTEVVKRIKQLSDAGDLPEVFRDVRTRLPILLEIIVHMQHENENLSPEAKKALEEIVRQCFQQASQLDEMLKRIKISKGDSLLKKTFKASVSLIEEKRVQRIATALRDNVQVLTFLNVIPTEKERPKAQRWLSEPLPSYESATGVFIVPFSRDQQFVGRESSLDSIASSFRTQPRVAISGIGGVG